MNIVGIMIINYLIVFIYSHYWDYNCYNYNYH